MNFPKNSIFNYTDFLSFIQSHYNHRKEVDKNFSLRTWAKEMELSSVSPLKEIINGRRKVKSKYADFLLKGLQLNEFEEIFFHTLIKLENCRDEAERKMFLTLLKDLTPTEILSRKESDNQDIFSHWVYMAVLSMSKLKDFKLTEENICKTLKGDVDEEFIKLVLYKLINEGLLIKDDQGNLIKKYDVTTMKNDIKYKSVENYFHQVFDLAKNEISSPIDQREFQCFSMPIKAENIEIAKKMIRDFRYKLSLLGEENADEVFQMNMQFFPLTQHLDKENSSERRYNMER